MAPHGVTGTGFAAIPSGFALNSEEAYPRCGVSFGLGLADLNIPQTKERVVNIGLDRQSFLNRGWSNQQLGAWNNGSSTERGGLFLSMFYALQMCNANDLGNPWTEPTHDWDRGLGAHIDFWSKNVRNLPYNLYVYDNPNPPSRQGIISGRNGNESPFSGGGPCSGTNVIGCAGGSDTIFLRADYSWALGHRIDEPVWILGLDGKYRLNITYVIAHEAGHFFGFPHVTDDGCMMNPTIGSDAAKRPRWQVPEGEMNPLFVELANKLNG